MVDIHTIGMFEFSLKGHVSKYGETYYFFLKKDENENWNYLEEVIVASLRAKKLRIILAYV